MRRVTGGVETPRKFSSAFSEIELLRDLEFSIRQSLHTCHEYDEMRVLDALSRLDRFRKARDNGFVFIDW